MGLNIGVRVKQQPEGFMQLGCNPKGSLEEIADSLQLHLENEMGGPVDRRASNFTVSVTLGQYPVWGEGNWYTFDVRVTSYGGPLSVATGKTSWDLQRELVIWAWEQFDDEEGVEMKTYWVG